MVFKDLLEDARNIVKKDPAARNIFTVILLYPGFHILVFYRLAHFLYNLHLFFLARLISQLRAIYYWNRNTPTVQKLKEGYL